MSSTTSTVAQELSTRKIGPVIISFAGTKLTQKESQLLASPNVGGVVLFRENWEKDSANPKTALKAFIASCRAINKNLIFMVDHEGGKIWRFVKSEGEISPEETFTRIPSAKSIGIEYDKDNVAGLKSAYENGYIMASELRDCGVDCSLAPVLDLDGPSNVIGKLERGFHKNPFITAKLTEAFIRGMNAAGMHATAKHFPGHGTCLADSHTETPVDNRPIKELVKDLFPFRENIRKRKLGAVMPGHFICPAVDPNHPAGFSDIWIKRLLREKYKFDGVVMSDCLSMAGATVGSGSGLDRLLAAQSAGCDFLMLTHQHNTPDHPDPNKRHLLLDHLLSVIDTIPDTPDSARRRAEFAIGPTPKKTEDCKDSGESQQVAMQAAIGTLTRAATTTTTATSEISTTVSPVMSQLRDAKKSGALYNQQQNTAQPQNTQPVRSVLNT
ncbi:MAG TPA: beta-N-acetylhexosaminidase [Gammaproteobacteria bacterium]|nr:beta-N-acetylhexosaminidase [Gammaproteobacteria bacterium]